MPLPIAIPVPLEDDRALAWAAAAAAWGEVYATKSVEEDLGCNLGYTGRWDEAGFLVCKEEGEWVGGAPNMAAALACASADETTEEGNWNLDPEEWSPAFPVAFPVEDDKVLKSVSPRRVWNYAVIL